MTIPSFPWIQALAHMLIKIRVTLRCLRLRVHSCNNHFNTYTSMIYAPVKHENMPIFKNHLVMNCDDYHKRFPQSIPSKPLQRGRDQGASGPSAQNAGRLILPLEIQPRILICTNIIKYIYISLYYIHILMPTYTITYVT